MAVPKSKISKSRRGQRRSHDRLNDNAYIEDADSGELRRPHHICLLYTSPSPRDQRGSRMPSSA